jgi:hypothetical protein
LLQGTAAATVAWIIAKHVAHHHEPFFAPIAAVVALNTTLGERGTNVLRLLLGVFVGIVVGELTIGALGGGYGRLALATFVAMAIARALDGNRIVIAQAAAGAILTVAVANGHPGLQRLGDALIGGGVALVFSQVLFSPEPVGLVRRAEAAALAEIANGLEVTARALEGADGALSELTMDRLRDVHDQLVELRRMGQASRRVTRHSVLWRSRSRTAAVARENENALRLDLLSGSFVMLARTAMGTSPADRRRLAPVVRELGDAIAALAKAHGDRATRQRAADRALDLARLLVRSGTQPPSPLAAAIMSAEMVAVDVMVFVGIDPERAVGAVRGGAGELRLPTEPTTPGMTFSSSRQHASR